MSTTTRSTTPTFTSIDAKTLISPYMAEILGPVRILEANLTCEQMPDGLYKYSYKLKMEPSPENAISTISTYASFSSSKITSDYSSGTIRANYKSSSKIRLAPSKRASSSRSVSLSKKVLSSRKKASSRSASSSKKASSRQKKASSRSVSPSKKASSRRKKASSRSVSPSKKASSRRKKTSSRSVSPSKKASSYQKKASLVRSLSHSPSPVKKSSSDRSLSSKRTSSTRRTSSAGSSFIHPDAISSISNISRRTRDKGEVRIKFSLYAINATSGKPACFVINVTYPATTILRDVIAECLAQNMERVNGPIAPRMSLIHGERLRRSTGIGEGQMKQPLYKFSEEGQIEIIADNNL